MGVGTLEASVSRKSLNSDEGQELGVAAKDLPNWRENVSNDKNHNIKKKLNMKLYNLLHYHCTQCPKKFSFYTVLAAHMLKHKKEFKCTGHVHDFQNDTELQKHVLENHSSTTVGDAVQLKNEAVVILEDINQVLNPCVIDTVITQNCNPSKESNPVSPEKVTFSEQNIVSDDKNCDNSDITRVELSGKYM